MPLGSPKTPPRSGKQRRLSEIEPYKVDLVDRAANKRRFIVFKEDAMSDKNNGPELIEGDGGLHSPETASDLERAAAALESMTTQIGALVTELKKGEDTPADPQPVDVEKANAAAAAFREVGEKALSIAKALEESGMKLDAKKLQDEAQDLIKVLQGCMEKYPAPGSGDKYPEPAAKACASAGGGKKTPARRLKSVAETALALAGQCRSGKVHPGIVTKVKELVAALKEFTTDFKVTKSETAAVLPEIMATEDPEDAKLAEATLAVLRDAAERLGLVSKVADDAEVETIAEPVATEVASVLSTVEALSEALPGKIEKAADRFSITLREVAERSLALSKAATEAGFDDARANREMREISGLVQGLIEKYPNVKKSAEMELSDLGSLLNVSRFLADFEAQIQKFRTAKAAPEPTPAPAPAAEAKKEPAPVQAQGEPAPAQGEPAPASAAITEPPKENPNADLLAKMEAMQKQIGDLQTLVAKARGTVQEPASAGDEGTGDEGGVVDPLLFPDNFNSPAYREALAKRASAKQGN